MNTDVPVGPATIVGYGLTLIGAALTTWASAAIHPAISAEVLLIVTIAAGVLTNLGRQLQSGKLPALPSDEEELSERPESAVTPDA